MEQKLKLWLETSIAIAKNATGESASDFAAEIVKRQNMIMDYKSQKHHDSGIDNNFFSKDKFIGKFCLIGQNPDDKTSCYTGKIEISCHSYGWQAEWAIGGYLHQAFGMLVAPNVLVFHFTYEEDNVAKSGMVAYTFLTADIVTGYWIEEGYPDKGIEHLRRLDAREASQKNISDANLGFSLN